LARAQSALTDAQGTLDTQSKNLSAAKTQADNLVGQRANAVRDAQTVFNAARADLAHVDADGTDPRTGKELTDAQKRDYADAFTTAERALTNAQGVLVQAQRDADVARQNEISGIASAEARVATAQADVTALTNGAGADVASAQAAVASAQSNLNKVIGSQADAAVTAQEANVAAAKAAVDRANGKLAQATAQAQMAGVRLDDATLKAPFAGVVAQVDAKVGELVGNAPVVSVLNLAAFEVIVTVDEVDVANIAVGQPVVVLVDALGLPTLTGSVVRVSPEAQSDRGVVSYEVTVQVTPDERAFKAGMTASAQIITAAAKGVIGVPRSAIHEVDGVTMVTVIEGGKRVERAVTLGLRGNDMTEITSGIKAGDVVEVTAVSK
jgi:RND family efflux transporter MFP subunit